MNDDTHKRITLRMPKDIHKIISEKAKRNSHSMNAEIITRLANSLSTALLVPADYAIAKNYNSREEVQSYSESLESIAAELLSLSNGISKNFTENDSTENNDKSETT